MADAQKQLLRVRLQSLLRRMDPGERNWRSERLRERLMAWPPFVEARVLYAFHPLPTEPVWHDGRLLQDKIWAFPQAHKKEAQPPAPMEFRQIRSLGELVPGTWGIGEPPAEAPLAPPPDVILVPGVAFDEWGGRLGRGGGFYDATLASLPGLRLGLAFDIQLVERVPLAAHDERLHALVTESGVWAIPSE